MIPFEPRRIMRIPRIPDAFELLIAYLCIVAGIPLALGAPSPNSLKLLPGTLIQLWGATLFAGGALVVTGIALRHRRPTVRRLLIGLRIERAGLTPLAAGSAVFCLVIAVVGGWRSLLPAGTYLALSIACLSRSLEAKDSERGLDSAVRRANQ